MPTKESSDELNPDVPVSAKQVSREKRRGTLADYLAVAIATCGVGYFPIAPGTMGSLVGVLLFLWLWNVESGVVPVLALRLAFMLAATLVVTLAGIWAATQTERRLQKKDPSIVVIDEVAGQMLALMPLIIWLPTWWRVLAAFILFRAFDIWKPYPIRRLEGLKSGLGIMADDLGAGVYAGLIVLAICLLT